MLVFLDTGRLNNMDLTIIFILIAIVLLSLVLAGLGAYVVIHNSDEKEKESASPVIDVSGQYAVIVRPARESIEKVKPSLEDLAKWLSTTGTSPEEQARLIESWKKSIDDVVKVVDEGDRNGTVTYRIVIGPRSRPFCNFLSDDNYVTREQIRNHAEILPPYVLGCDCRLVPKLPWENPGKAGWKALVPENGAYSVPDWRHIA
ncbi:hypothetical protein SAMN05720469_11626 [Fibrobacter intestinalis]|uniref:Uncharacterized protein n=2 Tax=Fibrobacteraceae TaxID=204431 RepID=A0A1M6V0F6_9BACT|nr:hypothetical protein [Fibrobacter intestinalis]PBC66624.1 hypothetical protein BGX14_2251 [Fibrobacter sp. UWS1]PBC75017.1 hypothetical protein BGW94_2697 [Fibrobacter sp. NR9]MDD7298967.1 hypothetical protein [Fibrobacter intestinalis]SHK74918.1 hypothetical protein SAMN05720469_11626 [Fibrobacter intestinalis]SJZ94534.1 hypothetical protein SAMN02745108_02038 [Fibrobacter intestinalis]